MTTQQQIDAKVEKIVEETLSKIKQKEPSDYEKLNKDAEKKNKLIAEVRKTTKEVFALAGVRDIKQRAIEPFLLKHLPAERMKLIKDGLLHPTTFTIDITKKSDGFHYMYVYRHGQTIFPEKRLTTPADVDAADDLQTASIIVECVLLVLNAVGIEVKLSSDEITNISKEILSEISNNPEINKAMDELYAAFESGNPEQEAESIFDLVKALSNANDLWDIIKKICSGMPWYDWLETVAVVTAMIIAALATDGAALIAEILLALNSAYNLVKKFTNLKHLKKIRSSM